MYGSDKIFNDIGIMTLFSQVRVGSKFLINVFDYNLKLIERSCLIIFDDRLRNFMIRQH